MKIIHFRLFMRKKGSMSIHASNRLLNFLTTNVNADVSFCIMLYCNISMDIAALSMGISQADVINNVETAVLAKSLDTMKETGAGLIDMMDRSAMERSVNPDIGANIDIMV